MYQNAKAHFHFRDWGWTRVTHCKTLPNDVLCPEKLRIKMRIFAIGNSHEALWIANYRRHNSATFAMPSWIRPHTPLCGVSRKRKSSNEGSKRLKESGKGSIPLREEALRFPALILKPFNILNCIKCPLDNHCKDRRHINPPFALRINPSRDQGCPAEKHVFTSVASQSNHRILGEVSTYRMIHARWGRAWKTFISITYITSLPNQSQHLAGSASPSSISTPH